jgi:2-polyprenyl-3-methyl-5-hydroxy-6-metoxy-1,4-benzoquinol methylase
LPAGNGLAYTSPHYWDGVWSRPPRLRLPSGVNILTRNLQQLLSRRVKPGMRFLEIGCAPGKLLSWVAKRLRATVSGLDYSQRGMAYARQLFEHLGIPGDLRCEDLFATTFAPGSFDVVFSAGLIEHFEDPHQIVARHVDLLKPGGMAIISIPHFGGVYGFLEARCHPQNLAIHNLAIMNCRSLARLAPASASRVRTYPAGRFTPWILSLDQVLPRRAAFLASWALNGLGLIQPLDIEWLCPLLVLEMRRTTDPAC